ncbi:MAG: type II toxin-antitoxin system RelE/ParE family toxin [Acidobacteriota bacterium]|nr:type II toxin-antitoxin system RelE/ParE family toxin [Acidobacteriota bacterium]
MVEIVYSTAALNDLEHIGDHISETLKNPIAALNILNEIQDSISNIADFPLVGAPLSSIVKIDTDYRFLVCGNYLVFYRAQVERVYIDRVIYGRRDYLSILFGKLT